MARTNWGPIVGIGVIIAAVGGVMMRCKMPALKPLCDAWPEGQSPQILDDLIAEYNQLPTIADNPTTSNYRSTRLQKSNPEAVKKIDARQKAAGTAAAVAVAREAQRKQSLTPAQNVAEFKSSAYCKTYYNQNSQCPCPSGQVRNKLTGKCNKPITGSNYTSNSYLGNFNSFNTFTLNRVSIR